MYVHYNMCHNNIINVCSQHNIIHHLKYAHGNNICVNETLKPKPTKF